MRLSGQDCGRGTFSHRHAVWWDTQGRAGLHEEVPLTPERPEGYVPLNHLGGEQARFEVYDSPLSEYAVLAFEYGYSLSRPDALVIWEAQFGDFSNGAQVIIDNFIASAEAKWGKPTGLVLLLPHGYEGQGPEHSSAHLERFLQLAAGDNLQVANLTTPAQLFHLLRLQSRAARASPWSLMSPKSLLRHPRAVSPLAELAGGGFHEVLEEPEAPGTVRRLVLASGKIYYELAERRRALGLSDTALVRLEQLYPFPEKELARVLGRFREAERFLWVQEEPENRGALHYMRRELAGRFPGVRFQFVSRPASASPAVGSHRLHQQEQEESAGRGLGRGPTRWGESLPACGAPPPPRGNAHEAEHPGSVRRRVRDPGHPGRLAQGRGAERARRGRSCSSWRRTRPRWPCRRRLPASCTSRWKRAGTWRSGR